MTLTEGPDSEAATAYNAATPSETTALLSSPESPRPRSQHSHAGSMNMRALVLHVLGDALGNIGVIATGLVIWLSSWGFKYYFDPVISLVITVIIFSSALPLGESCFLRFFLDLFPFYHIINVRYSISPQCIFHPFARRAFYSFIGRSPLVGSRR